MKRKHRLIAAAAGILILAAGFQTAAWAASEAAGHTYYVATNGTDRNDGLSISHPFRTIQKAADAASSGDRVFVRGGIYNEAVVIEGSGTKSAPILFQNYNGEDPVIDGTGINAEAGVYLPGNDYVIFSGFTVCSFTSYNEAVVIGIFVEGSGSGVEIRNCKVHEIKTTYAGEETDRNAHGIAVYGTQNDSRAPIDGIILSGNEVYNCQLGQSESVVLNGNVTNFQVLNNKIHDNDNIGIDFAGFEGTANDEEEGDRTAMQDRARNGVCAENRIWNITCAKNPTYLGDGLCADGLYADGGYNILLERNVINNCDIGIEAASEHYGCSAEKVIIRNNLIKNCSGVGGISFGGSDSAENGDAKSISILNNTIYRCEPGINIQNANSRTNFYIFRLTFRWESRCGKIQVW